MLKLPGKATTEDVTGMVVTVAKTVDVVRGRGSSNSRN